MPDDQVTEESHTMTLEDLLQIFLDGMMSGVTSTLINEKYGPEQVEMSRAEASYRMMMFTQDPAAVETVRDAIRSRVSGDESWTRTVLKINGIGDDDE